MGTSMVMYRTKNDMAQVPPGKGTAVDIMQYRTDLPTTGFTDMLYIVLQDYTADYTTTMYIWQDDSYRKLTGTVGSGGGTQEYQQVTKLGVTLESTGARFYQFPIPASPELLRAPAEVLIFERSNDDIIVSWVDYSLSDGSIFTPNDFVQFDGKMALKKLYEREMVEDVSWTDEGSLHRKKITRDEWLRIDGLNVMNGNPRNLIPFTFTSNLMNGYRITASSSYNNENHAPYSAFSQVDGRAWLTSNNSFPPWVQVEFPSPVIIGRYSMKQQSPNAPYNTRAPKDWILQAWDGLVWVDIKKESNENFTGYDLNYYDLPYNNKKYSIYRFLITATIGSTDFIGFGGLELFDSQNKTLIYHDGEYKKFENKYREFHETKMTSNITPTPYVVSSSGDYNTSYPAWKAFNGSNVDGADSWVSTHNGYVNSWIQIDYGEKRKVSKVSIISRNLVGTEVTSLKDFFISYSDDNINFVEIARYTNCPSWASNEKRVFEFNKEANARYWRITILNIQNPTTAPHASIGEIEFQYEKDIKKWSNVEALNSSNYLSDGMDSLSPLLDRSVTTLEPLQMLNKSDILLSGEEGKVFSKTLDLKKYMDIRSVKVEVK